MSSSLFSLVYQSTPTALLTDEALRNVLATARYFNSHHRISGLLLYAHGQLMQLLEGEQAPIRALYARIERDPRHENVELIAAGPAVQREFPDWAMGFTTTDASPLMTSGALDVIRPDFLLGREHNFSEATRARIEAFLVAPMS